MHELFDTSRVRDEPDIWDGLAERVAARAIGASEQEKSLNWLTGAGVGWVAACLVLLGAASLVVVNQGRARIDEERVAWTRALGPGDAIGSAIARGESPPALINLVIAAQGARSQ